MLLVCTNMPAVTDGHVCLPRYPSDDINKFLWMVRIGGGVFPDIKEPDYLGERGYTIDDKAGKVELKHMQLLLKPLPQYSLAFPHMMLLDLCKAHSCTTCRHMYPDCQSA